MFRPAFEPKQRLHKIQRNFSLIRSSPTATNATLYSDFKEIVNASPDSAKCHSCNSGDHLIPCQHSTAQIFVLTVVLKSVCHVD